MCTREPARGVKSGGPPPDKTNDPEFPAWLRVPPASAPSRSQASFPVSARRSSGTVGQHLPDVRPSVHPRLPSPGFPSSLCLSILPAGGDSGPRVKFRPGQQHFPPDWGQVTHIHSRSLGLPGAQWLCGRRLHGDAMRMEGVGATGSAAPARRTRLSARCWDPPPRCGSSGTVPGEHAPDRGVHAQLGSPLVTSLSGTRVHLGPQRPVSTCGRGPGWGLRSHPLASSPPHPCETGF